MSDRIRGKILHRWVEKGLILILGDDKNRYMGHWNFTKQVKAKEGKKVYFYIGEPELLPYGTVSGLPTALDVRRFSELPEDEQRYWLVKSSSVPLEDRIAQLKKELAMLTGEYSK